MMDATKIHSFNSFVRMLYAYSTPEIARHNGWLKIGDTEQGVHKRIKQQTHTADVRFELEWKDIAMYRDDCTYFRDHDFHDYLTEYKGIECNDHTEWFRIDGVALRRCFEEFVSRDYQQKGLHYSYKLRDEQQRAVEKTLTYLENNNGEGKFLWNAKPRFGKTLTAYGMIRKMQARNVLIVINRVGDSLKAAVVQNIIKPASEEYKLTQAQTKRMVRDSQKELESKIEKIKGDFEQQRKIAKVKHDEARRQAANEKELEDAENALRQEMELALKGVNEAIKEATDDIINNKPKEVIERIEKDKEKRKKASVEDEVRAHLRGFARTIPSFIMAYDDGNLTLDNFDENIEDDVFKEVTSITLEEFRFLRDGGDYTENGVQKHFSGHLFDVVVFDDAIAEFRKKRQELANYFDESQTEDIFDYIPPQKTNQIFTPKWVVKKMVDLLEQENPYIFEDPNKTFADLYMKSGLYITEIVRRLYNNVEMRRHIPDDHERILHILRHQVYGFAPTRIIYLIATRFILGFDLSLHTEQSNFRQVDTVPYAKEGRMEELIEREFGTI